MVTSVAPAVLKGCAEVNMSHARAVERRMNLLTPEDFSVLLPWGSYTILVGTRGWIPVRVSILPGEKGRN